MLWVLENLLVVTIATILMAAVLVLAIFLWLTRHFPHADTRASFGAAMGSIVITVLLSVMLNNLWAAKRDRDNRLRAIRDQHYSQLKPVLRAESAQLAGLADTIGKVGHLNRVDQYEGTDSDVRAMLWPDVLSPDLKQHFPEYDKAKNDLKSEIEQQDSEFKFVVALVDKNKALVSAGPYWADVDAMSFVEKSLGHGNGVVLQITSGGFSFSYWGVGMSGGGKPSADQVTAFRAFHSLKASPEVLSHCDILKNRAKDIQQKAQNLSKQAQRLAESSLLPGACEFMASRSLSD